MRIRLWLHLLFVLFAVFLTLPKSLAMLTVAALTKSAHLADFSSVTTTTTKASVLRSGGATGSSAVCLGRAKASSLLLVGILAPNWGTFDENQSTLPAESEITVYRAFGGDARAQGFSWTTTDPRTVANFRDAAGLPSGGASGATNTADFLIQGKKRQPIATCVPSFRLGAISMKRSIKLLVAEGAHWPCILLSKRFK